ncbi:M20 family metallo-hydrolase [Clostridium oceanicum]|uniref:M20 family metallo-hydrolase n=1 Tax=Clostridium oceanicum TaxID=1543 RepID=A0ABN1JD52_9CLOT
MNLGEIVFNKLQELGKITSSEEGVTRFFLTKEHKKANKLLKTWMEDAGLKVKVDNVGNIVGEYRSAFENAPTLVMGSHQDTVKNGGKYDGALGIVLPIVVFKDFIKKVKTLPYNFKIIGFGDEEGGRFGTIYLGSKAVVGTFDYELLNEIDDDGVRLKEALENFGVEGNKIEESKIKEKVDGYLEVHIEQGPVLEDANIPVGIVKGIVGCHIYNFTFEGMAGHAGTVPMDLRKDAGVGVCSTVVEIEKYVSTVDDLVATIGKIDFSPYSINVIPGKATFTLDIRSSNDEIIIDSIQKIKKIAQNIATRRGLKLDIQNINKASSCNCDESITKILEKSILSVKNIDINPFYLYSGAGHDAQELKKITNIGMLFVRCKEGISHNPKESITPEDIEVASNVLTEFLKLYPNNN